MSDRQPVTHELKTEPQYFEASLRGDKPYEIRRNDRDFEVGDYLRLREFDRSTEVYSGRELTVVVTHILSGAPYVPEGYVAMGVRRVVGEGELAELRRIAEAAPPSIWRQMRWRAAMNWARKALRTEGRGGDGS